MPLMVVHPTVDVLPQGTPSQPLDGAQIAGSLPAIQTERLSSAQSPEEVFASLQGKTLAHAQLYVDSARCLADFDQFTEAERHLKEAYEIATQAGASQLALADITGYMALLIDRNPSRAEEAEQEYRVALNLYKRIGFTGENASIALHNLKENLENRGLSQDIHQLEETYSAFSKTNDQANPVS